MGVYVVNGCLLLMDGCEPMNEIDFVLLLSQVIYVQLSTSRTHTHVRTLGRTRCGRLRNGMERQGGGGDTHDAKSILPDI